MNHPPVSPDLNVTENVFNLASRLLNNYLIGNFINSKDELWSKVKEYLESIPIEMVNRLTESMPKRIQQVRVNAGDHTSY